MLSDVPISRDLVFDDLNGHDKASLLKFFAAQIGAASGLDSEILWQKMLEREELGSTGIGSGVAVPHCRCECNGESVVAVGVASKGIEFEAVDGEPAKLFFAIVSPESKPQENLKILAAISRWVKDKDNLENLLRVPLKPAILEALGRSE